MTVAPYLRGMSPLVPCVACGRFVRYEEAVSRPVGDGVGVCHPANVCHPTDVAEQTVKVARNAATAASMAERNLS